MSIFTSLVFPRTRTFIGCPKTKLSRRTRLHQLKQKIAQHFQGVDLKNHDQLCERLETLPITVAEVRACIPAPKKGEIYNKTVLLQLPNGAYIAILGWNFGLGYGLIHNHNEADCYFTCLCQAVAEHTYKANRDGVLQQHQQSIFTKGMVRYLPKDAIHQVKGYRTDYGVPASLDYAITLHLYTSPTDNCEFYELGQLLALPDQSE